MHDASPSLKLELYETLCDSLDDSVVLLNGEGMVVHTNQRFCEATGLARERTTGRHYTELDRFIRDESVSPFRKHIDAVLTGEATERRVELRTTTPVEGDLVVEARLTPFDHPDCEGVAVVFRDITEQIERTEALARKSEQVTVVNRVLRHDIHNDMNIILGWGERLDHHLATDEGREILDLLLRHSRHIVELTNASRGLIESIEEEWELECRPIDVGNTLTREVELVQERYLEADISVVTTLPSVSVMANEFLGSVFANILSNAIRHNDADTPAIEITVEQTGETVSVAIADNGPGIPTDLKEDIYESGAKGLDSSSTGLGLYLVQSLVHAYGGTVTITDNDPRGTIVTVELHRASETG